MPSDPVNTSHGITIAFGTSSWTAEITDISGPGITRESIDVSHQDSTDAMEFLPADLYDPGELTWTVHFNPDTLPPINGAPETITITWKGGATWEFQGFITGFEPDAPHLDKMTGSVTLKATGPITETAPV